MNEWMARRPVRHANGVLAALVLLAVGPSPARAQDSEAGRILAADLRIRWITTDVTGVHIHVAAGGFAAGQLATIRERVTRARADVIRRLGLAAVPDFHVFYVGSRVEMKAVTGYPVTGLAYTGSDAVVLVYNAAWRAFEHHEFAHLLGVAAWGQPGEPGAPSLEGTAVYVDGRCAGYAVGEVVRSLADAGALLPWPTLLGDFRGQDDLVAYLQAGAAIEFAAGTRGLDAVRRLWTDGLRSIPRELGMTIEEFDLAWRTWLTATFAPVRAEHLAAIRSTGCGIAP